MAPKKAASAKAKTKTSPSSKASAKAKAKAKAKVEAKKAPVSILKRPASAVEEADETVEQDEEEEEGEEEQDEKAGDAQDAEAVGAEEVAEAEEEAEAAVEEEEEEEEAEEAGKILKRPAAAMEEADAAAADKRREALEATRRAIASLAATKGKGKGKGTDEDSKPSPSKTSPSKSPATVTKAEGDEEEEEEKVMQKSPKRTRRAGVAVAEITEQVRELLARISSVNALQRNAFAGGYDALASPLSKVTKDMVREGFTWLKAIERELAKPEPNAASLEKLSTSFYSVVPLRENEGKDCIASLELFKKRLRVVAMLSDIEAAHSQWKVLLQAAEEAASEGTDALTTEKTDLLYKGLKCELTAEVAGSTAWQLVQEYLSRTKPDSSSPALVPRSVFAVNRFADGPRFTRFAKNANRVLLWHGTRLTGWLSLLAHGPRLPPKEAPDMGYAFGKGLYFWDVAGPAVALCDAESEGSANRAFLLLAEVALGNSRKLSAADSHADKLPIGCQSVMGTGALAPDPAADRRLEDGVRVPLGQVRQVPQASALQHNQFVVYNAAQVRMRYLVEVELTPAS